jgi:protein-tyrosine phosphatase
MWDNVIAIAGLSNLRDVGGSPAGVGRRVERRKLFRAEALIFPGATAKASYFMAQNQAAYEALGLRSVIDLRGAAEVSAAPSAWPQATGAELLHAPLDAANEGDALQIVRRLREGTLREFGVEDLGRFYGLLVRRHARTFGRVIEHLAGPGRLPALVHCLAGKDRTGILIALLLESLGAPRDFVVADYAMTGVLRPNRVMQYLDVLEPAGIDPEAVRPLFDSPAEAMQTMLDGVDAEFGDVGRFLVEAAGVSPEALEALRDKLTAPAEAVA